MGLASIFFILSWYLKKDLREDILRLMVLEAALFSFNDANDLGQIFRQNIK